jgi:hypothetical protein
MVVPQRRLLCKWGDVFFLARTGLQRYNVICTRCLHAIHRLHAPQPSQPNPPPPPPLSPAERFRQNWSKPEDTTSPQPRSIFTLDELAKATYRQPTISKIERSKPASLEMLEAAQEDQLRQIEHEANLETLDDLYSTELEPDFDVFEGEITRGSAGLSLLAGRDLIKPKNWIKQGSLIETRGYPSN